MELFFLALLILLLALALGSGYPVAFALPGSAIVAIAAAAVCGYLFTGETDAYFAQGGPSQWLSAGVTNLRGIYWEVERDTLIAIPLFIFMGIMLQRSKIAEDLLITMAQLFGPVPGGLGISVVFVGALLAATTGIVGATVVAMGLISLPVMMRNNYSHSLATGTIAASGTLGQIIPPSIVLIILADQLASATDQASTARKALYKVATGEISMPSEFDVSSTSAGEMFLGAFVPGLVLVGLYMAYILIYALLRPSKAPAVKFEGAYDKKFFGTVLGTLVPPLTLIFLVLGSIITGIATVNQAGAIGAAGALLMAGYRLKPGKGSYRPAILAGISLIAIGILLATFDNNIKDIKTERDQLGILLSIIAVAGLLIALIWSGIRVHRIENTLYDVMIDTAKTTSLVFIILLGAAMLTAAFRAFGGEELVRDYLNSLPGGFWSKFIIVMAVIFVLGFFLDFIEIAVVVVPIVAPILLADPSANITAVWLGVMIGLNIQTSFLTPPFGFALFYMRGVAPAIVKTVSMYKGVIVFILLQLGALAIVGYYPQLVNYLPKRMSLTSDTAPPPRNPKLQHCLENYVSEQFARNADQITRAIDSTRTLDFSVLPDKLAKSVTESFDHAGNSIALLATAEDAAAALDTGSISYRPLHRTVRDIQLEVKQIDTELAELKTRAGRLNNPEQQDARTRLENRMTQLASEKENMLATVPSQWEDAQAEFEELRKAERKARLDYRKAADKGYSPIVKLQEQLAATADMKALDGELEALVSQIENTEPAEAISAIEVLSAKFSDIAGASKIKTGLSKARRALKAKKPSVEKALKQVAAAQQEYDEQMQWRGAAESEIASSIAQYESTIRTTIGARQQSKLSREQALYVAACDAGHRDISLNF